MRRQSGFSLVGIMVTVLAASLLSAAVVYGVRSQMDQGKIHTARHQLSEAFPRAIAQYIPMRGVPRGDYDITQFLIDQGVPSETPWHEHWRARIANSDNRAEATVIVYYPIRAGTNRKDNMYITQEIDNGLDMRALSSSNNMLRVIYTITGSPLPERR